MIRASKRLFYKIHFFTIFIQWENEVSSRTPQTEVPVWLPHDSLASQFTCVIFPCHFLPMAIISMLPSKDWWLWSCDYVLSGLHSWTRSHNWCYLHWAQELQVCYFQFSVRKDSRWSVMPTEWSHVIVPQFSSGQFSVHGMRIVPSTCATVNCGKEQAGHVYCRTVFLEAYNVSMFLFCD